MDFKLQENQRKSTYSLDSTTRINADNSSKKVITIFWALFTIFQIIVFTTSNFTPEAFVYKTNASQLSDTQHNECKNPIQFNMDILSCKNFDRNTPKLGLIMRNLSPMNQFAQISLLYIPKNNLSQTLTIKQQFAFELLSLNRKIIEGSQNKKYFAFTKGKTIKKIQKVQFDSSAETLQSIEYYSNKYQKGYEIKLGFYRQFVADDALLVITFSNLNKEELSNYEIVPIAMLMNPRYTKFTLITRFLFLIITALSFFFYLRNTVTIRKTIQRKTIAILSGTILLFNDPTYIISVLKPSIAGIFLSTLFVALFIITLVLSWVVILQKIVAENKGEQFLITQKKKVVYASVASVYFLIIFTFNFQIGYYSFTQSPIIPLHSLFKKLYLAFVVLFGLIFLYIGWLYFSIIKNWDYVIWRHKIYCAFNAFFILLNLVFISLGWFSFYDESSQKFQIFYASMNFYVIYLQYMYSTPTQQRSELDKQPFYINQARKSKKYDKIAEDCVTIDLELEQEKDIELSLKY